jgi:sec-independent protein translocase protein TatA
MPGWIGFPELLVLLLVVLLVFGPKRLPEMGRSLGKGMREFKDSITGKDGNADKAELPPPAPNIEANTTAASASETDKVSTSSTS